MEETRPPAHPAHRLRAGTSLITAVGKAIYWTLGAVQTVGEWVGLARGIVRSARRGSLPLNDTDPIPLSKRPPPPSSRYR